jgi:putative membrane protein
MSIAATRHSTLQEEHSMMARKPALAVMTLGLALAAGAGAQTSYGTGPAGAKAADTPATKAAASNPDRGFVEKAAMGGMAEVELGNLAQQKASSAEVKQFAARMVEDHGKANDELKQLASSKGIPLPTALDRKHRSDMDRLGKLSGAEFDRAYMSHMLDDHKKDVAEFKKQATSGKDSDLKAFASKSVPVLEQHLQLAQKTNDSVKKGAGK